MKIPETNKKQSTHDSSSIMKQPIMKLFYWHNHQQQILKILRRRRSNNHKVRQTGVLSPHNTKVQKLNQLDYQIQQKPKIKHETALSLVTCNYLTAHLIGIDISYFHKGGFMVKQTSVTPKSPFFPMHLCMTRIEHIRVNII